MSRDKKQEIWLIEDKDECYDIKTGEAVPIYKFAGSTFRPDKKTVKRKDAEHATLEELVHLCDQDAENINAHDFVGAHRLLGAVLYRQLGRETATVVMRDIAYRRGLHGMSGICGTRDSYADLGVGQNGRDWGGNYGA